MTEAAKQKRRDVNNQKGNALISDFFPGDVAADDSIEKATAAGEIESIEDEPEVITVTFTDNSDNTSGDARQTRPIVANLDAEDDDDESHDNDEGNSDGEDEPKKGVQQEYLEAVRAQLKLECNSQWGRQNEDWILDQLKEQGWCLRKECAPKIARRLSLAVHHVTYYRDIRVWIPDLQYGKDCMPSCPCCKSNNRVTVHGFDSKHFARLVVGLTQNYYIMSRRYRCERCKEKNEALKRSFDSEGIDVQIEKGFQYTFKPWNENSLPLLPRSLSEEFPAFLTRKCGLDKTVLDLMRPLINQGVRPKSISEMLLELHSKEYNKCHIRYEEDNAHKSQFSGGFPEYSDFDDEFAYRGKVPTGAYLQSVYIKFHRTIRRHLANEVKKRGGTVLSIDASYKTAKHMCQYKGEPVFKALVTVTNEFGEIRMQFHVVSDSHEQMEAAFESFLQTTKEYGYPPVQLAFTDNPTRDKAFLLSKFPSLKAHQEKLDSLMSQTDAVSVEPTLPLMPYQSSDVVVLSKTAEINRFFTAMRNIVAETNKAVAVDAEWKVDLNRDGRPSKSYKVGLIQLCFLDQDGSYKIGLIRTNKLTRLPTNIISFFKDDSIHIVGVHVGGDLAKIGRDFNLERVMDSRRGGNSVINLGGYARDRDVVQDGKVSLEELTSVVLKQCIEKQPHLRYSDWNKTILDPDQVKYAALDALASLRIYDAIKTLPDLNIRLTAPEAIEGKRVDVVPRSGSVQCMATRAATGTISASTPCKSPEGVTPDSVKPGRNHAVVKIDTVYSPSMKVPRYKKDGQAATIDDFKNCDVVMPVQMLKEHVPSDSIRPTPVNAGQEHPNEGERRVSKPASQNNTSTTTADATATEGPLMDNDNPEVEENDDYSITEVVDFDDFTSLDCENLRCAIFSASQSQTGAPPMKCRYLDEPPKPESIKDVYSVVLGDNFHAMDRPNIPVKHEAKKAFKNALKNATFIWNESKMEELVTQMKLGGMDEDEIESAKYFRPTIFHDCVERIVPTPKVLYWRLRAVFALYGPMKDSKTKAPLFNRRAWKKANNVLREVLLGLYSDPPGVAMYTKKIKEDGSVEKNKYGMEVIECLRGTPRTEAVHKSLITTFGGWNMGVEMSSCVLAEFRHRYNHRCSERRRCGFPRIGHYDTWATDKIQNLVHKNHGRLLYSGWSNASDFKETDESFDTTAIHSSRLHSALKQRWIELSSEEKSSVKLTSDQKFLCHEMNTELPFLPFATFDEYRAYNALVVDGKLPPDEDDAAVEWCKLVDGVKIHAKLPVHLRVYRERWERNRRIKDAVKRAKSGSEKLKELNAALVPECDERQNVSQQEAIPAQRLPAVTTQAITTEPYVITARTSIGNLPSDPPHISKSGKRGKDRQPRSGRKCKACTACNGKDASTCRGRGGVMLCRNFCSSCIDMGRYEVAANCPGRLDRSQCVQGKKRRLVLG